MGTDEAPLSAAEALDLAERQRAASRRELEVNQAVVYAAWGLAWLVAYGVTFLAHGGSNPPIAPLPDWILGVVWPAATAGALLVMGVHIGRRRRGVGGASAAEGRWFGLGWLIAFAAALPVAFALRPGGPEDLEYWLFPSVVISVVVGTAYIFSGVGWRDRLLYVVGAWILAVNALGVLVGFAWYPLVLALLGGGGFLVAAAVETARKRRA